MRGTKALTIILSALFLVGGAASAQEYAYQVGVCSKDINLRLLNLPGSTPLEDVLALLPEFLNNSDLSLSFGQYDVQIEGISVDCAANSIIKNMHLSDIKSISISESPSASQQKNSSGGVVNLKLNEVPEGFSGRASVNLSSSSEYQPSAILNYHKDNLTVRSWFMFDYYTPGSRNEYRTMVTNRGSLYAIDTTGSRSSSQMARIYADYAPTEDDTFQFRIWESSSTSDNYKYMQMISSGESDAGGRSSNESRNLSTTASYTHRFSNGHKLNAELGYLYMPQYGKDVRRNTLNVKGEPNKEVQTLSRTYQTDGKLSYSLPLIKAGDETRLEMKAGSNLTVKTIRNEFTEKSNLAGVLRIPSQMDGDYVMRYPESSLFLSPFIELGGGWKALQYKANIKFQHLKTTSVHQAGSNEISTYSNDLTGNLNVAWQMAPHHHLRLTFDESVIRPSNWQMIPVPVYRPDKSGYVVGNPDLMSSKLNSVNLNYVTDFKAKNSNMFINASLGFIHTEGLINSVHGFIDMGSLLPYISYDNSGSSDVMKAELMFNINNGPLMLTFSSNFFDKLQRVEEKKDYNLYYNFSIGSLYRITDKWNLAGELVYSGPIYRPTVEHSPSFNGSLRISKIWDSLESFLEVNNILHKVRWEVTKSTELTTYRYYDLFASSVLLGFSYHF